MSGDTNDAHPPHRDVLTGVLAVVFGWFYRQQAHSIENSLLSDEVGAGGVPGAIGAFFCLVGLALIVKGLWYVAKTPAVESTPTDWRKHGMALSLLMVLAFYVLVLPVIGYMLAVALMMAMVAWLAGSKQHRTVILMAVIGGPSLWVLFDQVLRVRMPAGFWGA
jgi:putative tricarboxylic transport membrane protein